MATRNQSLAELERAFVEETQEDRERRERMRRLTVSRARRREIERVHKHGTLRFVALVLALVMTAVVVTVVMFRTLYVVMG